MWAWLTGGYAVVLAALIGFAGFVASSVDNEGLPIPCPLNP